MKKVITYGTFDLFHQGHYNILKRAKAAGDYLIVGVTGESYDLERGKINVRDSLITRIENVRKTGFADQIIVEEYQGQKVDDILKYNVDIFCVGSDWVGKFDYLRNYCKVVYFERTKDISSTQLRDMEKVLKIGIVSESLNDGGIIYESKFVSGIHVEAVFSKDVKIACEFSEKYELNGYYTNYEKFLDNVDVVYVHSEKKERYFWTQRALEKKKHVIVESPVVLQEASMNQLFEIAHRNHVLLIEDIIMTYLRAFNQLIWMLNGNLIGEIIGIDARILYQDFHEEKELDEMLVYPVILVNKLLREKPKQILHDKLEYECIFYHRIQIKYDSAIVNITVGKEIKMKSELIIYGTKGSVYIPEDWWNTGYFEAEFMDEKNKKRFSFNFEGNGFRYLLQELLIMIKEQKRECIRIFDRDAIKLIQTVKEIMK